MGEKAGGAARPRVTNLLGHIQVHKLLVVDALFEARSGHLSTAHESLDASWRLAGALREEPVLLPQLLAVVGTRFHAGALRYLEDVPPSWRDRLDQVRFRDSVFEALQLEGRLWLSRGDHPEFFWPQPNFPQREAHRLTKPYTRFSLAHLSDSLRVRLETVRSLEHLCDRDLAAIGADLDLPIPWWNLPAEVAVPNFLGAVHRTARMELDVELTRIILELKRLRRADGATRPFLLPRTQRSRACPEDHWVYRVRPYQGVSIELSRDVQWPGSRGAVLPTRFSTGP